MQGGRRRRLGLRPRPHRVWFGSLGRVEPISRRFGFDRGTPVDRRYIEAFLERKVFLRCWVKVAEDWTRDEARVRELTKDRE